MNYQQPIIRPDCITIFKLWILTRQESSAISLYLLQHLTESMDVVHQTTRNTLVCVCVCLAAALRGAEWRQSDGQRINTLQVCITALRSVLSNTHTRKISSLHYPG